MSYEQAEEFVESIVRDEELREEFDERLDLSEDADPETVREKMVEIVPGFAAEHGYEFTAEEGFEALENLETRLSKSELTDEELENVAGGDDKTAKDYKEIAVSAYTVLIGCLVSVSQGSDCSLV